MRVLAIDTATFTASAAVVDVDDAGGHQVRASGDVLTVTAGHGERLVPYLAELLDGAGLALSSVDAFAVGAGPGSFTGLRIGLATAKGLAFAGERPLWLVSSLAALAWDVAAAEPAHDGLLLPVLDARRGELYAGFYRRSGASVEAHGPERVLPPAALAGALAELAASQPIAGGPALCAGDALAVHGDALAGLPAHVVRRPDIRATPSAVAVAVIAATGRRVDALTHGAPAYIRPSEAEVKYPDGVPGALRRR